MKKPLLPELHGGAGGDGAVSRRVGGGASLPGAVFNISTSMIGCGIMSIPAATRVLGVAPFFALVAATAALFDYSVEFLLRYARSPEDGAATYAGVMGESFGKAGSVALELCVALTNAGALAVFLIIIGDVTSGARSGGTVHAGLLQEWFGEHWWVERWVVVLVLLLLVLLPLALPRQIDSLWFSSAISVLLAVVFVVITLVVAIYSLFQGRTQSPRLLPDLEKESFYDLFTAVPVVVLAFTFHFNVHPIRAELERTSDMKVAVMVSLLICAIVYASVGFFGYLLFGDATMSDILANFDRSSLAFISPILNDVVRLSYAVHLALVFPVVFFSLRINVDSLLFRKSGQPLAADNVRFLSITSALLLLIYVAAIVIPDIWTVFQLFGSSTAVCLSLVFPASIALRDIRRVCTRGEKVLAASMIVLAVITSSIAIASNVSSYFSHG